MNNITNLRNNQPQVQSMDILASSNTLISKKRRKTLWNDEVNISNQNSKWSKETDKTFTPLPFNYIPNNMSLNDFEIMIRKTRLININKRLSTNDWEEKDARLRSPSPEPIYDKKTYLRINTFDNRMKSKYLNEKNNIIEELLLLDSKFKAPFDFIPKKKTCKLYYKNTTENNITALIIGPEGKTQRELEKRTGCKISIRGEGSRWNDNSYDSNLLNNEPIHVFLQADDVKTLEKGNLIIEPLLNPFSKEHFAFKNEQKNSYDRQLGIVKNSYSEIGCENCGMKGHSTWACPLISNDSNIKCTICGDYGHPSNDCLLNINRDKTEESEIIEPKVIKEIESSVLFKGLNQEELISAQKDIILKEREILDSDNDNVNKGSSQNENSIRLENASIPSNTNSLLNPNTNIINPQTPQNPQNLNINNPIMNNNQFMMFANQMPNMPFIMTPYGPRMQISNQMLFLQQQKLLNPFLFQQISKNNQKPYNYYKPTGGNN